MPLSSYPGGGGGPRTSLHQVAINDQMMVIDNPKDLLEFLDRQMNDLNPVNLATAINRYSVLAKGGRKRSAMDSDHDRCLASPFHLGDLCRVVPCCPVLQVEQGGHPGGSRVDTI